MTYKFLLVLALLPFSCTALCRGYPGSARLYVSPSRTRPPSAVFCAESATFSALLPRPGMATAYPVTPMYRAAQLCDVLTNSSATLSGDNLRGSVLLVTRDRKCSFVDIARAANKLQAEGVVLLDLTIDDAIFLGGNCSAADPAVSLGRRPRAGFVSVGAGARAVLASPSGLVPYVQLTRDPGGSHVEPSIMLVLMATSIVIGGAMRAYPTDFGRRAPEDRILHRSTTSGSVWQVLGAVMVASLSLVLLATFPSLMMGLVVLFCVIFALPLTLFLTAVLQALCRYAGLSRWDRKFTLSWGSWQYSHMISATIAVVVIVLWAIYRLSVDLWYLTDFLVALYAVYVIGIIAPLVPSLRIVCFLLTAFLFYDVFWVYIQPSITDAVRPPADGSPSEAVMVTVAKSAQSYSVPLLLSIPAWSYDGPCGGSASMIGLGDIVLPALIVAQARLYDEALRRAEEIDANVDIQLEDILPSPEDPESGIDNLRAVENNQSTGGSPRASTSRQETTAGSSGALTLTSVDVTDDHILASDGVSLLESSRARVPSDRYHAPPGSSSCLCVYTVFPFSIFGYFVGLVLTYMAVAAGIGGQDGQPALLYIVPTVIAWLMLGVLAHPKGGLRALKYAWRGRLTVS